MPGWVERIKRQITSKAKTICWIYIINKKDVQN